LPILIYSKAIMNVLQWINTKRPAK